MNHTIDTLPQGDIQRFARLISDTFRSKPSTDCVARPPMVSCPTQHRHLDALAAIGATALALSRIEGDTGLAKLVETTTEGLSELDLAKFERLVAEAEVGLLDAYVASQSGTDAGTSGNTSP